MGDFLNPMTLFGFALVGCGVVLLIAAAAGVRTMRRQNRWTALDEPTMAEVPTVRRSVLLSETVLLQQVRPTPTRTR